MRYAPYEEEYDHVSKMTEAEILEYFLTRIFEAEEVWGLADKVEWVFQESTSKSSNNSTNSSTNSETFFLPVWPYERYASESANGKWQDLTPDAVALDDFIESTLSLLIDEDVMVEIMPTHTRPGCVISPHRLKSILEGMVEAGEYTLEG